MNQYDEFETMSECNVSDGFEDRVLVDAAGEPEPEPPSPARPLYEVSSMDGYLQSFGRILGKKAVTSLKPLHVPNHTELPDFNDILEHAAPLDLFDAQKHLIGAGVKVFGGNGSGFLCGECGVGKTVLSAISAYKHAQQSRAKGGRSGKFRCLVLCPDHLIGKWKREIETWIPDAKVYYFGSISKHEAKARKKDDGKTGQRPAINDLVNLLDKRDGDRWSKPEGPEYYIIGRDQVKWMPLWLGLSDPYKGFDGNESEKPTSSKTVVVDVVTVKDERGYTVYDKDGYVKRKNVTARVFCCPKCGNVVRDSKGVPISADAIKSNKRVCKGLYLKQLPREHGDKQSGLDTICPIPAKYKDRTSGTVTIGQNKYKVMTCNEPLWWFTSKLYRFSLARIIQKKFRRFFNYLIVDECHEQKSEDTGQSNSAGKLIGAIPHVMALTGTLIGGYAKDIFSLMMRICPTTLVEEGFEWGKDKEFSRQYGRIDRVVVTKEEPGSDKGVSKSVASMRRAKTGASKPKEHVKPGIMPTLFGNHMIGNTMFLALEEMAEGLPDLFEYIGGQCPPEPEPTGNDEQDEANLDRYERMKSFWVDTACGMKPRQKAEYDRIESTLLFAARQLLKRGSMKLLGTMLSVTIGWPDFCHAEWTIDDDLAKAIKESADDPDSTQAPALLGQSFLENFDQKFDANSETLILTRKDTGETDRIDTKKNAGIYWVDVTFNGTKTKRLAYDTGAASLSLPLGMAVDIGLDPTKGKDVLVQVADGRTVKSKQMAIGSVKVGKFTVNDVECNIDMPNSTTHTVGYWDKPDDKTLKNWMGVVTPQSIDPLAIYPKEQRLIDICKLHKSAGHQVWVYCQMTGKRNVMPRLKTLLEREGLKVGIMESNDVKPIEREEWIAEHGRKFDVMICFPKLVSTGLDLFSKVQGGHNYNCIVFYETGYKLNDMRQAARRAWRIGQPRDCFIYYLYYQGTMQHRAMSLMSKKMAAALALEGEFSEEGLAALCGEGDEHMALAKSMSEKIDDADMQRSWQKVKSVADKKKPAKKKPTEAIAELAKDAKPSPLDALPEEQQLLAETILEKQAEPADESERLVLTEGDIREFTTIGGAVKIGAFTGDTVSGYDKFDIGGKIEWVKVGESRPVILEPAESVMPCIATESEAIDTPLVGKIRLVDGNGKLIAETDVPIVTEPDYETAIDVQFKPEPEQNPSAALWNLAGEVWAKEKADRLVAKFTIEDGDDNVLAEMENTISTVGANDTISISPTITVTADDRKRAQELFDAVDDACTAEYYSTEPYDAAAQAKADREAIEAMIMNPPEPIKPVVSERPSLKVHRPEPEPAPNRVYGECDGVIFDDALLAKVMANIASHGMSADDIFG